MEGDEDHDARDLEAPDLDGAVRENRRQGTRGRTGFPAAARLKSNPQLEAAEVTAVPNRARRPLGSSARISQLTM